MRSWVDREEGRVERSAYCMHDESESIRHVLWDCPVYSTLRNDFVCLFQGFLGIYLNILRAWRVLKNHPLFWVVSCGSITLAQCLIFGWALE